MRAFAEMLEDVSRICDIVAHNLARTDVSYYNDDAKRTTGMYRQRTQKAWGHTAHRGWARLLLNRARDIIIHGPAHRGATGRTAAPTARRCRRTRTIRTATSSLTTPRGGLLRCLGARSHLYCRLHPRKRQTRALVLTGGPGAAPGGVASKNGEGHMRVQRGVISYSCR